MSWSELAQLVSLLIAVLAIIAGVWQFWASVKTNQAANALQCHKEYLKLCFERAEFSSTEQYLRSYPEEQIAVLAQERTFPATRYVWFLSYMLNSLEQTLEYVSANSEWREVALSQVGYHDRALAEVWEHQEWHRHYGRVLTGVVDEVLGRPLKPLRGVAQRGRPSPQASSLRVRASQAAAWTPDWRDRIPIPTWPVVGALLTGLFGGILLAWIIGSSSSPPADQAPPPIFTPEKAVEIVRTTAPSDNMSLLPWLIFILAVLLVCVFAWKALQWARASSLTKIEKAGFVSPALPGLGALWSWIKPQLSIELSDALHNLLAAGLLGLSALAAIVLAVGYLPAGTLRKVRMAAVSVIAILPPALFFVPSLRSDFAGSILVDGRIEAIYVGSILVVGYLGLAVSCVSALVHLSRESRRS